MQRVVKGGELPLINTLVDAYNVVSLKHILPVGGEDLDRCSGDIRLTLAEGGEPFTPLGADAEEPPEPGEVIYRDDTGVLCRKFNWREAARTCLTESTTSAVLVIEAIPPVTRSGLTEALQELRTLVETFSGATVQSSVLDAQAPGLLC